MAKVLSYNLDLDLTYLKKDLTAQVFYKGYLFFLISRRVILQTLLIVVLFNARTTCATRNPLWLSDLCMI